MRTLMVNGCTRVLGKAQGYNGLPVRDLDVEGIPAMLSSWEPTPAELEDLKAGAPIYLWLMGTVHPPVRMTVGPRPIEVGQ